ncbi:aquaporin [Myriangium duriaei CBS 260.36]|uniref:Aquaporin n=1 Tax=Myriangium duriaei CBS 260.36 TaxID=1168546 RepID=A0A9P4IZK7_9PEZI|nr:aquaporin [Myriangium duriaei CBS 260.36]
MCGEFVGTVLFLFFALSGAQVANSIPSSAGLTVAQTGSNPQQLQYIALCFGFSLAVNAWVFFRISGGLFNPAVTLGMCLIGALPWIRGVLLFFTQILGGLASAALVSCMFPGGLNVQTTLGGGTTIVQGVFIEMFLTAQLVFTIFMLAAEKHKGTYIAPVGIGLSLFIAELTGVYFTGGSLNPARSFGPAVVDRSFVGYHWIYWVGPILGSIVAAGFYKFIKLLEYETANPGQDLDHAVNVENKMALLMAAGINETDARQVANELSEPVVEGDHGGIDGRVMANGQGRRSFVGEAQGMYGTQFRGSKEDVHRLSQDSGPTFVESRIQRPAATSTGSQVGRYSYLGRAGANRTASQQTTAMTMNDQTSAAPSATTTPDQRFTGTHPQQNYSRTISSGV